jgi:predicted ATPase/DNA-binding CsgD family transcriptional regulator
VQRDRNRPNNLPLPLSSLVGRIAAVAQVRQLVLSNRLVTLTGPGGVGKTRLALEVASGLLDAFHDGAWWVDLAPLGDASLLAHTVAAALGVPEDPSRSKVDTLVDHLRDRDLLLVFDNCEHLISESARLAARLLSHVPRLRIIATSREPLGVDGETVWPVPPLTLPCLEGRHTAQSVIESEAGQLFVERARAAQPDFELTEAVARAIGQVCCQLDGIPLAIELAAARVRVLSVPQIAAHLDDLFQLLNKGRRTAPLRHQAIEATIRWSYDLLTPQERVVFERLAGFVSTFSLEAAQAVASDLAGPMPILPADVLDLLSQLVLKSLVIMRQGEQARYSMLDTIRHYAWQQLAASGELERIRQRHLAYYLELAEYAESKLAGADQESWLKLLEIEHDNLRAALTWSQESKAGKAGLRLASALASFWMRVDHVSEASGWLERALGAFRVGGLVRIQALYQAGRLASGRGDYEQALAFARQGLALSRDLGDARGEARTLGLMGWIAHGRGDRRAAGPLLEQSLARAQESGDERTMARTRLFLGDLRLRQGAVEEAANLFQESRVFYEKEGDQWCLAWALGGLGEVERIQGDLERAEAYFRLSLQLYRDLGSTTEIPYPLEALALAAADRGLYRQGARLFGAASAIRDRHHASLEPSYQADYAPTLAKLRAILGEEAFGAAWTEGRAMTLAQALALAFEPPTAMEPAQPAPTRAGNEPDVHPTSQPEDHGLTPREGDVLRLLASGLSDAQIAEELVISPRTVGKHVQSIYGKLHLHTRSAATRWAIEHGLG